MSTLSPRLPASLHQQLKELSQREGVSINQFVSAAVGEKMAALVTATYLEDRARRAARNRFERIGAGARCRPGPRPAPGRLVESIQCQYFCGT